MDRILTVRIPDVLLGKMERVAAAEGMTQSELIRAAMRMYFANMLREDVAAISAVVRPQLEAEGITQDNVEEWYKQERKKKLTASKGTKPRAVRA